MKAIVYHDYGPPNALRLEEVEQPAPKDDEVLIKVRAAAANPLDWRLMGGEPKLLRIVPRIMKMPIGRPGVDVAGEVTAVGSNVTRFKPGDKVFGSCPGAFAEYACARESRITTKPDNVTYAQAAAINVAGLTALQGLRDKGKIQAGERVLINGAAGGVGTYAVQIARVFGAHVTGVCSTGNLELVQAIGADEVIDYTQSDFTESEQRYDLILDCVGNKSLSDCQRLLKPNGRCVLVGGPHDLKMLDLLRTPFETMALSAFSDRKIIMFVAKVVADDLAWVGEQITAGKMTSVIDHCYPLRDTAEAIAYLEAGHARGKVIIDVDQADGV